MQTGGVSALLNSASQNLHSNEMNYAVIRYPQLLFVLLKTLAKRSRVVFLLQSEGLGHGWGTHPSLCVAKAFQRYFDEDALPEPGTKCKTDFAAFYITNTSWDKLLPQLGFEPVTRRSNQLH
ncbi:uncharacterized protein LY79DRAFT_568925, partial [Colletotrichum navitas]